MRTQDCFCAVVSVIESDEPKDDHEWFLYQYMVERIARIVNPSAINLRRIALKAIRSIKPSQSNHRYFRHGWVESLLIALAPHLREDDIQDVWRLAEPLDISCQIPILAAYASKMPRTAVASALGAVLSKCADKSRHSLMYNLVGTAQLWIDVGGRSVALEIVETIEDASVWWP